MKRQAQIPTKPAMLVLHPQTAALLARPIRGRGGFQSLLRRIQAGLDGECLEVAEEDLNALVRASSRGGLKRMGGFQQRVLALITDLIINRWDEPRPPAPAPQLELPFQARRPERPLRVIRGGRRL